MESYLNGSPAVVNRTFAANSASHRAAVSVIGCWEPGSNVEMSNCVLCDGGDELWISDGSTITATYSDVQGAWPEEGCVDFDPVFVRRPIPEPDGECGTDHDYANERLLPGSPRVYAADNPAVRADAADLDGDDDLDLVVTLNTVDDNESRTVSIRNDLAN